MYEGPTLSSLGKVHRCTTPCKKLCKVFTKIQTFSNRNPILGLAFAEQILFRLLRKALEGMGEIKIEITKSQSHYPEA